MTTIYNRSKSNPTKIYKTLVDKAGRRSSCNCPGWIYSPKRLGEGNRDCRHTVAARAAVRKAAR